MKLLFAEMTPLKSPYHLISDVFSWFKLTFKSYTHKDPLHITIL